MGKEQGMPNSQLTNVKVPFQGNGMTHTLTGPLGSGSVVTGYKAPIVSVQEPKLWNVLDIVHTLMS